MKKEKGDKIMVKHKGRINFNNQAIIDHLDLGTVDKYIPEKGYGFIRGLFSGKSYFFHISKLKVSSISNRSDIIEKLNNGGINYSNKFWIWHDVDYKGDHKRDHVEIFISESEIEKNIVTIKTIFKGYLKKCVSSHTRIDYNLISFFEELLKDPYLEELNELFLDQYINSSEYCGFLVHNAHPEMVRSNLEYIILKYTESHDSEIYGSFKNTYTEKEVRILNSDLKKFIDSNSTNNQKISVAFKLGKDLLGEPFAFDLRSFNHDLKNKDPNLETLKKNWSDPLKIKDIIKFKEYLYAYLTPEEFERLEKERQDNSDNLMDFLKLNYPADYEYELFKAEIQKMSFTTSVELANYIVENNLGEKYKLISDKSLFSKIEQPCSLKEVISEPYYSRVCKELNLSTQKYNPYRDLLEQSEILKATNPAEYEYQQLIEEVRGLGFENSGQLSNYIMNNKLGYKYKHISGIGTFSKDLDSWSFMGTISREYYARVCNELNLGSQNSGATLKDFKSFKDLHNG